MRTDDMKMINDSTFNIVNLVRNMPFYGSQEQVQICQVLFLDKYFRKKVDFDPAYLDLYENSYSDDMITEFKKRYDYLFNELGFFKENRVSSISLSLIAEGILRRLNIQNNVVEGVIVIDINGKKVTYPHHFNEIKIGNDWYLYDFTLNLISEKWKEPEYKRALKFIKMPVSPVDYSFVNRNGKNIFITSLRTDKLNKVYSINKNELNDNFTKYKLMDRIKLFNEYSKIEKIFRAMNSDY